MSRPSLLRSFRQTNPVLKLSFSLCVAVGTLLLIELGCYAILQVRFGERPQPGFNKQLSGYRVFAHSPDHPVADLIGARADGVTSMRTDAFGFLCDSELTLEKPPGTVRIVLTGGSALAGSGQLRGRGYEDVHAYPTGMYAFSASIAGRLKAALQAAFPDRRIQVINAAYHQKTLHQSLVHYLEVISRLDPDYVVNMDGYNDQSMLREDPYALLERRWLPPYVDLYGRTHDDDRFWTTALLEGAARTYAPSLAPSFSVAGAVGPPGDGGPPAASREEYEQHRDQLFADAARWLQVFEHYMAVLQRDDTRWLFVLQPMLARDRNKPLSVRERRFAKLEGDGSVVRYFFDDLSDELEERVQRAGFLYVDMGKEIQHLESGVELYTDYCHLTPEGNAIVARRMAEAIGADLRPAEGRR